MTDDPLNRLFAELHELRESMNAQFKSIQDTIYSNNTEILQRLTSAERWQLEHEKTDTATRGMLLDKNSERSAEIRDLALELGKATGAQEIRTSAVEKFAESIKTSVGIWKWIFGASVAGFGIVEALVHGRH